MDPLKVGDVSWLESAPLAKGGRKSKESGAMAKQREKIGKSQESPELHRSPLKPMKPAKKEVDLTTFRKQVNDFVQGIEKNQLKKGEMTKFYHMLKEARLPIPEKQLHQLRIVLANTGSPYFDNSSLQKIITLGTKLEKVLGAHLTEKIESKLQDIASHSGQIWECVDRVPNETGGYTYVYRLRDEFDDLTPGPDLNVRKQRILDKTKEMFPAVEPSGTEILRLDPTQDRGMIIDQIVEKSLNVFLNSLDPMTRMIIDSFISSMRETLRAAKTAEDKMYPVLNRLGYSLSTDAKEEKGHYLTLPDRETVIARWEKLREEQPHLPPFDILPSEGIADDVAFVNANLTHDTLLSSGQEFVHDHLLHIMPNLMLRLEISSSPQAQKNYSETKDHVVKMIADEYRSVMMFKDLFEAGKIDVQSLDPNLLIPDDATDSQSRIYIQNQIKNLDRDTVKATIQYVEALLGALVDQISSISSNAELSEFWGSSERRIIFVILAQDTWKSYLCKRFRIGESEITNIALIATLMKNMTDISRKKRKG